MTTDPDEPSEPDQQLVTSTPSQLSPSGRSDTGIKFDPGSVRRSGVILMTLAAAFLLGLWLFSVTRHFLFLILLAWLFAVALEPGIRALIARGRSRGPMEGVCGRIIGPQNPRDTCPERPSPAHARAAGRSKAVVTCVRGRAALRL